MPVYVWHVIRESGARGHEVSVWGKEEFMTIVRLARRNSSEWEGKK